MPDAITVTINGAPLAVEPATTVAAAIALATAAAASTTTTGTGATRRSVGGVLRAPLCGMGVCQECRVTVNRRAHVLACQTICRDGMQIETAK